MDGEDVKQLKKATLLLYCKGFLAVYRSKSCQTVGNGEYDTENESSQDTATIKKCHFLWFPTFVAHLEYIRIYT